jgi:hypothetical protein
LDVEGAAFVRLDPEENIDLDAADYRAGIPLTYGIGDYQMKLGYYHLSAHAGDEFLAKNPNFTRINYVRDAVVWGHSYYATPDIRLYGEVAWAFYTDGGAKPWEFQLGAEYVPARWNGSRGVPFAAINGHLREEVDFGGELSVQAGWAWRASRGEQLLRVGLQYVNGPSPMYEFYQDFEEQIGVGLWYDF